jgi:UDP-N-acetylmuramoylalanine--D-glutamate ligase
LDHHHAAVLGGLSEFEAPMMKYLKDATVLVLGLGDSGLAMARWCARFGANVRAWDSRDLTEQGAALAAHVPSAQWLRGMLTDETFVGVKLVLKSPGLSPIDGRIVGLLSRATDMGLLVQGELEIFAHALADLKAACGYIPQVLAITGTNGKTTTTSMTAMLIERAGKRVAVAGNIGPTMLQTLSDALDLEFGKAILEGVCTEKLSSHTAESELPTAVDAADDISSATAHAPLLYEDAELVILPNAPAAAPVFNHLPEVWVLELSSFQLHEVKGFEPSAATVLNITSDHLDWHGTHAHYVAAKARVFGQTAVMVINQDDAVVAQLVPSPKLIKGNKVRKSTTESRNVVRFSLSAPQRPGDYGLMEENGIAWLVRASELDETLQRGRGGKGRSALASEEIMIQRLMPADALRVRGRHNAANALAALALATAIDCPLAPMLHALREYAGEPHRVQYITTLKGVDFFDDSKGTNVGATVAALQGLGADQAPAKLVLILGGDGKGQSFAPLSEPVRRYVRAVATLGRDAALIEQTLVEAFETGVVVQRHDTLELATRWCFEHANTGDAVLLSPACASLDMFRNYGHRAEVFVNEVRALAAERGEVVV